MHEQESLHPDAALVRRIIEKDMGALVEAMNAYGPKVLAFLRSQFGDTLQQSELEDACNRAAFKLWRKAHQFDSTRGTFAGWLLTIAKNSANDILRTKQKHEPSVDPDEIDWSKQPVTPADLSPRQWQKLQLIDDFIHHRLVGFERIVGLTLLKTAGTVDTARLAKLHDKTRQNVDTVVSKIKRKLREALRAQESRPDDAKVTG